MSDLLTITDNKSSRNALKHAVYSTDIVLSWESKLEFEALHQAFREDYNPQGASEEEAVFDLASLHWKKRRLNIGSKLAFHRQSGSEKLTEASKGGWEGVAEYLSKSDDADQWTDTVRAMAKEHATAARQLCEFLLKHATETVFPSAPNAGPKKEQIDIEPLITVAKQLRIIGAEMVVPMMHAIESGNLSKADVEQAYRPDIMERELKLHAEISRQIEKVVKRLVMLQEYKRLYSRKSIEAK
jgi:hypothetical protein